MKNLLLAPHNDDETLFAAYIIQRYKPKVLIITDAYKHEKQFGEARGIISRRKESEEAMKILGVEVDFLGIPDNALYFDNLIVNLEDYEDYKKVFAPAKQGGHTVHDIVSDAALKVFGDRVEFYSTYAKNDLKLKGEIPIIPTDKEKEKKKKALECYKTQIMVNRHHFDAVNNSYEYLNSKQC